MGDDRYEASKLMSTYQDIQAAASRLKEMYPTPPRQIQQTLFKLEEAGLWLSSRGAEVTPDDMLT